MEPTPLGREGLWTRFFFPETSPVRLAVMRIVCVALQLVWFGESLSTQLVKLDAAGFYIPQLLIRGVVAVASEEAVRDPGTITAVYYATLAAGVLALVGLFTRVTMLAFAVGSILQVAHLYSYGEHHHPEAVFCVFLLLMALGPCGRALSMDAWIARKRGASADRWGPTARVTTAMWPIVTVQVLMAIAYFDSFLSKAIVGGLDWVNGYTLQTYLLQDGIRWDRPLGVYLAQSRPAGVVFAVGALVFEALFFVVLLVRFERFRRVRGFWLVVPLFLLAGTAMHLTIWLAQAAPFFQFLVLYLTWVPWERFWEGRTEDALGVRTRSASAAPAA